MAFQLNLFSLPLTIAAAGMVALAIIVWLRYRSKPEGAAATLLMLAVAQWSLCYALEIGSVDLSAKLFWAKTEYLGICALPIAWLWFAARYTRRERWAKPGLLGLLAVEPLIILFLVWTNDSHGLVWSGWRLDANWAVPLLHLDYGAAFWIGAIYSYILLTLGTLLIIEALVRARHLYRGQVGALLVAVSAPWLGNALHLSGASPLHPIDLTPFAFMISCVALCWALFRFHRLDLAPMANELVVESMDSGIIVLDDKNRILHLNPAAEQILSLSARDAIGHPADRALSRWKELSDCVCGERPILPEVAFGDGESKQQFDLRISPLNHRGGRAGGRLVVLHEVTKGKRMEADLVKSREHLEERVSARTGELSEANEDLRREIIDREKAEKALRESEARYRMLVEEATDIICTIELKSGVITSANNFGAKLLGYTPEAIIGKINFLQLVHPDDQEKVLERIQGLAFEKTRVPNFPLRLRRADGGYIHVENNGAVTYDAEGAPENFIGVLRDVTEQRRTTEALKESEQRYRMLVDHSLTGVCLVQGGRYVFANNRALEITGYSLDELTQMAFEDIIHPEDVDFVRNIVQQRLAGQNPTAQYQMRVVTKNGDTLWIETFGAPVEYQGSLALMVNLVDITERRKTEEALRLTQFSVDHAPDPVYWMGMDARFVYVNEAACKTLGYSREELLSMTVHDIDPDSPAEAWPEHWKELRELRTQTFETHHRAKDGGIHPVQITANLLEFMGKEYNCAVAHDITNRKEAEERIRKSEEKYRSLFEESKDCVFITSPEGAFIDINPAGIELFGYSTKNELLKANLERDIYVHPEDRETFQSVMAQMGFVKDYELLLKSRDDRELNILVTANAVRNAGGEVAAYRGIMRNITDQKKLEQQLFHAQKMEGIGTLAGGIAHDFNNILGGILGYASFMKTKMDGEHPFYNYVNTIESGAMRAAELTSQLLAFARGGKYETRPIDLNGIVDETLKLLGRTLDKSIEIIHCLQTDLPTVEADAGQMQQVLVNLCVNAGDAMPHGGKMIIETKVENLDREYSDGHMGVKPGQYVIVTVTDNGVGMAKETMRRIFEPFYTTKEEGKGSGLGLSMVYGVVKNHGGFINVYSELREGTTFKVYLPISGKSEVKKTAHIEEVAGGNEFILVVDDEEPIRNLAREILQSYGYRVLLAEDGVEAVEICKERNGEINLVILDMVMPNMGGREAFLRIKEIAPRIRALLSTGYSKNRKAQEILDSGVMGFVQKPYQAGTLLSAVRQVLDAKALV